MGSIGNKAPLKKDNSVSVTIRAKAFIRYMEGHTPCMDVGSGIGPDKCCPKARHLRMQ